MESHSSTSKKTQEAKHHAPQTSSDISIQVAQLFMREYKARKHKQPISIEDKDLLVFLGFTGVGKSTIANYLHGVNFTLTEDEDYGDIHLQPQADSKLYAPMGKDDLGEAQTIIPNILPFNLSGTQKLMLVDLPALQSNPMKRLAPQELCGHISSQAVFNKNNRISHIFLVIEHAQMTQTRSNLFKELSIAFSRILSKDKEALAALAKRLVLLVNRAPSKIRKAQVIGKLQEIQINIKSRIDKCKQELTDENGTQLSDARKKRIIEKIKSLESQYFLLTLLLANPDAVLLVNPADKGESRELMRQLIHQQHQQASNQHSEIAPKIPGDMLQFYHPSKQLIDFEQMEEDNARQAQFSALTASLVGWAEKFNEALDALDELQKSMDDNQIRSSQMSSLNVQIQQVNAINQTNRDQAKFTEEQIKLVIQSLKACADDTLQAASNNRKQLFQCESEIKALTTREKHLNQSELEPFKSVVIESSAEHLKYVAFGTAATATTAIVATTATGSAAAGAAAAAGAGAAAATGAAAAATGAAAAAGAGAAAAAATGGTAAATATSATAAAGAGAAAAAATGGTAAATATSATAAAGAGITALLFAHPFVVGGVAFSGLAGIAYTAYLKMCTRDMTIAYPPQNGESNNGLGFDECKISIEEKGEVANLVEKKEAGLLQERKYERRPSDNSQGNYQRYEATLTINTLYTNAIRLDLFLARHKLYQAQLSSIRKKLSETKNQEASLKESIKTLEQKMSQLIGLQVSLDRAHQRGKITATSIDTDVVQPVREACEAINEYVKSQTQKTKQALAESKASFGTKMGWFKQYIHLFDFLNLIKNVFVKAKHPKSDEFLTFGQSYKKWAEHIAKHIKASSTQQARISCSSSSATLPIKPTAQTPLASSSISTPTSVEISDTNQGQDEHVNFSEQSMTSVTPQ